MSDAVAPRESIISARPLAALLSASVPAAWVQVALLLTPLLVIPFFRLVDPDFWWHLKTGELIVHEGLFDRDPFSWTAAGKPWVLHEWLAEAMIYGVQTTLGYWANALLFGAATAAALVLAYGTARRLGAGSRTLVLLMLLAVGIVSTSVTVRPQVFSWLLFALFLNLLHRDSEGEQAQLWVLPPLMVLWANLHLGFVYGLMLLACWGAALAFDCARGRKRTLVQPAMIISACAVAACLNPEGPAILLYPLRYLTDAGSTHASVSEWQSPNIMSPFHWPIFAGIAVLFRSLLGRGRPRPFLLIVTVVIIVLSLQAVRNAPYVALLLPPVAGAAGAAHWRAASSAADTHVRVPAITAAALVGLTVMVASSLMLAWGSDVSLGAPSERNFPAAGAAYIEREYPGARMFNEYGAGGYLIDRLHPETPVNIDGRSDFYGDEILTGYFTVFRAEDGWQTLLAESGVEVVLVSPQSPIARALRDSADWREELEDEQGSVFVRNDVAEAS